MSSPIHFDRSHPSVVIMCDLCPHWRALRLSLDSARECAANHERDLHPDLDQHQHARRQRDYARRHADTAPEMLLEPDAAR